MENNSKFKLKKIPVEVLMDILEELFENGFDYVDFEGEPDKENLRDTIILTVNPTYHFEFVTEEENASDITVVNNDKLSDDDLNHLI